LRDKVKGMEDRMTQLETDLKWAKDEIENLETGGKGYEKEGQVF
jgi:hypothetical protein